jgi:hypothetical protein
VERLRHRDGVRGVVGQRQVLGRAVENLDPRQRRSQLRPHPGHRLDGHDAGAGRDQQPRQLAGPGGEVDHPATRADGAVAHDVGNDLRGVRGARPLVRGGVAAEPQRRIPQPLAHGRLLVVR